MEDKVTVVKDWDKERGYRINPTGDPLNLEDQIPSTVCFATDVMKYKIVTKIRERERKLFVLLVHAVWHDLGKKTYHTIKIENIKRVFQAVGNVKDYGDWLFEYLDNLSDIKVRYEDEKLKGVTHLFAEAWVNKERGEVKFCIPPTLTQALLSAEFFARLDTYFIVGLSGKYSIALYQFLESKIEMRKFNPEFTPEEEDRFIQIPLQELRDVLAVKDGEYKQWIHFRDRVLTPAVEEINTNPVHSTFTIKTETVRGARRKIVAVKFFLRKTWERCEREQEIRIAKKQKRPNYLDKNLDPYSQAIPEHRVMEIVSTNASGWDHKELYMQWRRKAAKERDGFQNEGSFVKYCMGAGPYQRRGRSQSSGFFDSLLGRLSGNG